MPDMKNTSKTNTARFVLRASALIDTEYPQKICLPNNDAPRRADSHTGT